MLTLSCPPQILINFITLLQIMSRWLGNSAVQGELANVLKDRESAWMQMSPSKDKPFWRRRVRTTLQNRLIIGWVHYNETTMPWKTFMGTNVINWDAAGNPTTTTPSKRKSAEVNTKSMGGLSPP